MKFESFPLLGRGTTLLSQTSQKTTVWSSRQAGAHERKAFDQFGRVAKLALKAEGSVALPSGADPRTEQSIHSVCVHRAPTLVPSNGERAPSQEPVRSKAKRVSALVSCLLPVLACLCRGFPGSGSLVLWPCPFGFLFVLVPPHVSFYWPRASRSSSRREGRRVKSLFFSGDVPRTVLEARGNPVTGL